LFFAHFAANFWTVGIFVKEYEAKIIKFVQRKLEIPLKCPLKCTFIYLKKTGSCLQPSHQNTKDLQSKLTKLYTDSLSLSSHVIVFTETWLKPGILRSQVFPSKYTAYRVDRPSEVITSDEINDTEFLCIKLSLLGISIYITCSYIPPSSEFPIYANHLSAIQFISS